MARTVIYPTKGPRGFGPAGGQPGDNVPDKLLKYIPGETIAFYVPLYHQLIDDVARHRGMAYALLAIGLVGTVGYLYVQADKQSPPRPYFYVLAAVSFVAWALGITSVGQLWMDAAAADNLGKFVLPVAVFLIPLIDQALTRLTTPKLL